MIVRRWSAWRSGSEPHRRVVRAGALLALADGASVRSVARVLGSHQDTVRRWRDRFLESGPAGVGAVAPGRGRKPEIAAAVVEAIVDDTLHSVPDDGSAAWSTRSMAQRHGVGKDTVARVWRARELRPWRADTFKVSRDPDFEAELVDVVGLYMDPPERAAVFSFDDKTQVQALDRTQASLPLRPGRARTLTHDYKRNGTVELFAALNVATGEVLHQTPRRHTAATCWPSSNGSTCTPPDTSTSTSCWTTSPRTSPSPRATGSPTPNENAGTCTSPPHRPHGSTSSRPGSPCSPAKPPPTTASTPQPISPTPSTPGPKTGTTTPSPSPGPKPLMTSSPKSNEDDPPSPKPRRTTRRRSDQLRRCWPWLPPVRLGGNSRLSALSVRYSQRFVTGAQSCSALP